jgi:UDP-glucose 4-epimerase
MASRGSVIPLFIDQIKSNQPLTITDPTMTRFLMSLEEAVNLVLYAFEHGEPGDLFVQKSPAATVGELATSLIELMKTDSEINIIGPRHAEKKHETLLTREEKLNSQDLGDYFKIPIDNRSLNYDKYFLNGLKNIDQIDDYSSENAIRLSVQDIKSILLKYNIIEKVESLK